MTAPSVLLLDDSHDAQLVERARRGSGRARRRLCRRMRTTLYPLAYAWTGHPFSATRAVRVAARSALTDRSRPYGAAVVAALHRQTHGAAGPDRGEASAFQRAVTVLCDDRRLPPAAAAMLLGLSAEQVADHHRAGRAALGLGAVETELPRCAGWPLVSRDPEGLTAAERTAAAGHLELCRTCRDALDARRRARQALRASGVVGGGGAVAVAAIAIDGVLTVAGPATVAGGIGVLGGLGVGIGHLAQPHPPALPSHHRPAPVGVAADRKAPALAPKPHRTSAAPAVRRAGAGSAGGVVRPAAPSPADTKAPQSSGGPGLPGIPGVLPPASAAPAPLPTGKLLPLPLPLPSLPVPLPTQLITPVPLPTLPVPLPTVTVPLPLPSLAPLPLPSLPSLSLG